MDEWMGEWVDGWMNRWMVIGHSNIDLYKPYFFIKIKPVFQITVLTEENCPCVCLSAGVNRAVQGLGFLDNKDPRERTEKG